MADIEENGKLSVAMNPTGKVFRTPGGTYRVLVTGDHDKILRELRSEHVQPVQGQERNLVVK